LAPNVSAAQSVRIKLHPETILEKETVQLADIAVVSGGKTEDRQAMAATVVARAPQPGQTRFVGRDYIRIRLKQAGFKTADIRFEGVQDVRIARQSASLPAEPIRRAVESAIRSRMPWQNEDVRISAIEFDESVRLPTGKLTYRVIPKRHEDYLGQTVLGLHLFVDGQPVRKLWVNARIAVMADVVTVAKPLGKHQHIQLADLTLQRHDLADLGADAIRRMEDAVGRRTTRMIYPDTVLQTGMIAMPPLVKRGDVVKIVAAAGSMTITATGRVKEQGRIGEMIRVMNTGSKRIILARVTGPGSVQVDF
jgi:flagella basal body P-ring formation protein FlgA